MNCRELGIPWVLLWSERTSWTGFLSFCLYPRHLKTPKFRTVSWLPALHHLSLVLANLCLLHSLILLIHRTNSLTYSYAKDKQLCTHLKHLHQQKLWGAAPVARKRRWVLYSCGSASTDQQTPSVNACSLLNTSLLLCDYHIFSLLCMCGHGTGHVYVCVCEWFSQHKKGRHQVVAVAPWPQKRIPLWGYFDTLTVSPWVKAKVSLSRPNAGAAETIHKMMGWDCEMVK